MKYVQNLKSHHPNTRVMLSDMLGAKFKFFKGLVILSSPTVTLTLHLDKGADFVRLDGKLIFMLDGNPCNIASPEACKRIMVIMAQSGDAVVIRKGLSEYVRKKLNARIAKCRLKLHSRRDVCGYYGYTSAAPEEYTVITVEEKQLALQI